MSDLLGARVRLIDCDDMHGTVVCHERYLDGSERWIVAYWRKTVSCERRELVVAL